MPCLLAGASGELSILEGKSGLFSVLLVESCLASITFFSAITFLDAVSLGLSTDIDFLIGETVSHRQSRTWSTLQRFPSIRIFPTHERSFSRQRQRDEIASFPALVEVEAA